MRNQISGTLTTKIHIKGSKLEPTNIIGDSSPCLINKLNNKPNLIIDSVFHSSLYPNSHYNTKSTKLDLKIQHPSFYERNVWYYQKVNVDQIRISNKNRA